MNMCCEKFIPQISIIRGNLVPYRAEGPSADTKCSQPAERDRIIDNGNF